MKANTKICYMYDKGIHLVKIGKKKAYICVNIHEAFEKIKEVANNDVL